MGTGSSEVAGKFQQIADLGEHTACGIPYTTLDSHISHGGGKGKANLCGVWSLVSTTVYEFELKPSYRMHFDHSWWPHGKFSSVKF